MLLLYLHPIFLFKCYDDRQHLHSFPTRRSSDLSTTHSCNYRRRPPVNAVRPPAKPRALERERPAVGRREETRRRDRKSTRLNSSHTVISYAVYCLKKKKENNVYVDFMVPSNFTA